MTSPLELEPFEAVLRRHGLHAASEMPFPHDGWSGARLAVRQRDGRRYVIKRDSLAWDWIARATLDGPVLREAWFARHGPALPAPLWAPYLGAGMEGAGEPAGGPDAASSPVAALLMPDLTGVLLPWEEAADATTLERAVGAMATLHAHRWTVGALADGPWCPVRERLLLLSRPAAERYHADGNPVGQRFLAGWDAFDEAADPAARDLIHGLAAEPGPLLAALERLPTTLLHGDLKLANVGFAADGRIAVVDWQMVMVAPVAVELGWFLVSNAPFLPVGPETVLADYRRAMDAAGGGAVLGDWAAQVDLAILVGLLLRGWRKGLDAAAQARYPSGVPARDDLAWWCDRATEAAARRL